MRRWIRDYWAALVVFGVGCAVLFGPKEPAQVAIGAALDLGVAWFAGRLVFIVWRAVTRRPCYDRTPMPEDQRDEFDTIVSTILEFDRDDRDFMADALSEVPVGYGYSGAANRAWRALTRSQRFHSLEPSLDEVTTVLEGADTFCVAVAVHDLIHPKDFDLLFGPWRVAHADWHDWSHTPNRRNVPLTLGAGS